MVGATGAFEALSIILNRLPREFQLPILFVWSMPDVFLEGTVARLAHRSSLPVVAVEDEQVPQAGNVYVAGTDRNLLFEQGRLRFIGRDPKSHDTMDVLFHSMARELGTGAVAVILSGMSKDGAQGLRAVRDAGGFTIAQDEATSIVYGMPWEAVRLNAACESLAVQHIAPRLLELVGAYPKVAM
jgi:two-component system chemotaxis response regulator CheB